uniref:NADH-ubiquinone oxidoreductase chain 2 n=1 Tax=Cymus sp. TaxID=2931286 RepID=A0A8T9ZXB1_9HEMI|nr:NADH dehydrogenase subunit 2 [Cymus sp.]
MNFNKMFLVLMIMSTAIVINSTNWVSMWMGMEMNLMFFIPFISKSKNKNSSQAMMIYFMVQSISSMIMLFSILIDSFIVISPVMMEETLKSMLTMSLLMKLGAAPFHNWMIETLMSMKWLEAFILLTWQKVAPLFVLSNIMQSKVIMLVIMMTTAIGAIGGINYSSMMKIMGYSSINHMGWMLMSMNSSMLWYKYFILYSMNLMMACLFFNKFNMYYINQIFNNSNSILEKINFSIIMLSMSGLPPFLGFVPKLMVINNSMNMFLMMFMIMMSLLTLFYYTRMISSILMMYSMSNKFMKSKSSNMIMYNLMLNMMMPLMMIMFN